MTVLCLGEIGVLCLSGCCKLLQISSSQLAISISVVSPEEVHNIDAEEFPEVNEGDLFREVVHREVGVDGQILTM